MKIQRGCRVIITGSGSGLGKELSLLFAKRGARLWVTDLTLESANATAHACLQAGATEAKALACDVRNPGDFETLSRLIRDEWKGIDLLVNNAGVAAAGAFDEVSLEDWQWVIDTNLWGVIHGCHAFFPMMKESNHGAILNIASAAGLLSPPKMGAYNVAKAAVIALSETLRSECVGTGVRISVACPTFFKSCLLQNSRIRDDETRETARILFERSFCSVHDVAASCLRAIESDRFYVLPSWDARLFWRIKRAIPSAFPKLTAKIIPQPKSAKT